MITPERATGSLGICHSIHQTERCTHYLVQPRPEMLV
nr:MAG TPA: hypothetical protein [Caudoviricetes sp.]